MAGLGWCQMPENLRPSIIAEELLVRFMIEGEA
jgi:hypothetical protein